MLAKPYFRTCQRFRRATGAGRDYLALWTLTSAEGMTTAEYTAQWGFREWEEYVADWSRDLFDGGAATEMAFARAARRRAARRVVRRCERRTKRTRRAAALASSLPDMMWLPVIGLDRHTPWIGLRPLDRSRRVTAIGSRRVTKQFSRQSTGRSSRSELRSPTSSSLRVAPDVAAMIGY